MNTGQRTFVTYDADFPDDSEWDQNDNLIMPGGRNVAAWFREQCLEQGFECSEVVQHSFYGWQFEARTGKRIVQCILQGGHPWLMISQPHIASPEAFAGHDDHEPLHTFILAVHVRS